jgi:ADP-heptose:LPS heptosyltransferase
MESLFLLASSLASAAVNAAGAVARRGPVRSVVVFKLDHLGDLVTAAPALASLRERRPDARVTLVVGSWCEDLAREGVPFDELVVYDSPSFARAPRPGGSVEGGRGALATLRAALPRRRFDLAVGLRDDGATVMHCLLGGALGRRDRGSVRLAHALRRAASRLAGRHAPTLHEVVTNLRAVGAADVDPPPPPVLRVREGLRRWAREEVLSSWGGERPVVVHPGSASPLRRWPEERYAVLARWLVRERGVPVAVTGTAEERPMCERASIADPRCRVLAGELGVPQMMGLLAESRLCVGPDTGMLHVAAGVGAPVVALFGPNDPARFGPIGPAAQVVWARVPCSPCAQRGCSRSALCMEAIGLEEVKRAVDRALASGAEPAPGGVSP